MNRKPSNKIYNFRTTLLTIFVYGKNGARAAGIFWFADGRCLTGHCHQNSIVPFGHAWNPLSRLAQKFLHFL